MRGQRLAAAVTQASGWAAGLCLAGIVCAGALQVVFRYVLNAPLAWPEEVSRLLLVWLTYLGALVLPHSGRHVAVGVLYDRLPPSRRRAADLLADVLGVGFFGALTVGGLELVGAMRGILLPALQLPLNLIFGLLLLVSALQVYLHAAAAIRRLGGRPRPPGGGR